MIKVDPFLPSVYVAPILAWVLSALADAANGMAGKELISKAEETIALESGLSNNNSNCNKG